eukprot:4721835-Lingulodinium_polyedra.AAC.1
MARCRDGPSAGPPTLAPKPACIRCLARVTAKRTATGDAGAWKSPVGCFLDPNRWAARRAIGTARRSRFPAAGDPRR